MERYVLGIAFTPDRRHVLLIQKTHPEWQKGKWNGIGGHIEPGELPIKAMIREAEEETCIATDFDWKHYATMQGDDFECFVFAGMISEPPINYSDSGERLHIWRLPLRNLPRIAGLDFLIEAALARESFDHLKIAYGSNGDTGQVK